MFGLQETTPEITHSNHFSWRIGKREAQDSLERPMPSHIHTHSGSGSVGTGCHASRWDFSLLQPIAFPEMCHLACTWLESLTYRIPEGEADVGEKLKLSFKG